MSSWGLSNLFIAFGITFAAGLATLVGCVLVFLSPKPNPRLLSFGLAFAGGAMVYVALTEILQKSVLAFGQGWGERYALMAATAAFLTGMALVLLLDRCVPHPHDSLESNDPKYSQKSRDMVARVGLMTAIAITAHNFPEGLATFFATLDNPKVGAPLALAIAVHNIPEGISIAAPIYYATRNKAYTLGICAISGLAEPLGALLGYVALRPYLSPAVFGGVFGLIAGVMVYLALDELLPAAKRYALGHETVYGLITGMAVISISLVLFQL